MQILSRAILLAALLLLANSAAVRAQSVGYVADVGGQWLLNNSQQLRDGQQLPTGGVITNQSRREQDYIAIANLKGELVDSLSRSCKVAGECSRAISLPRTKSAGFAGVISTIVEGTMGVIYGEPERVVVPRGRRIFALPEGVVLVDGDQIDLSLIFRQREADLYYLGLIPKGDAPGAKALGPITFKWNPNKPSRVAVPGIAPGLYELTLLRAVDDGYVRTDADSWILIASRRNYKTANESFLQVEALTEKWNRRVTPEVRHSFLRASLNYLATRQSK